MNPVLALQIGAAGVDQFAALRIALGQLGTHPVQHRALEIDHLSTGRVQILELTLGGKITERSCGCRSRKSGLARRNATT